MGMGVVPDDLAAELKDFQGAAATLRFDGGSLELEAAGDTGKDVTGSGDLADLVGNLPDDTALAYGMGLDPGWLDDLLGSDDLVQELEEATGLDLPDDAETLLGQAAVLSVGGDVDVDEFFDSPDGSGVPVGLTVQGDTDAIQDVLARVGEETVLANDSDGDLIAIGPDADYRSQLLEGGDLGSTGTFRDAVPDADGAAMILYADVDVAAGLLTGSGVTDDEVGENLEPLGALGISARVDDGISHVVLQVTTD